MSLVVVCCLVPIPVAQVSVSASASSMPTREETRHVSQGRRCTTWASQATILPAPRASRVWRLASGPWTWTGPENNH